MSDLKLSKAKLIFLGILVLFFITILLINFSNNKKNVNIALKVKKELIAKDKKRPKVIKINAIAKNSEINPTPNLPATTPVPNKEEIELDSIAKLKNNLEFLDKLDESEVMENIELADEVISKEPDSYLGYKAKLILLLVLENKFNQDTYDYEIYKLLETMARFDMNSNKNSQKEAILLSENNSKIMNLEDKLEDLNEEKDDLVEQKDLEAEELKANNERIGLITIQIETLQAEIEKLKIENEEGFLTNEDYINEDIVHIPFLRALAKGDIEQVITDAKDFISVYPKSIYPYFYLIKALEMSNDIEAINNLNQNILIDQKSLEELKTMLNNNKNTNFKEFWKNLKFI